MITGMKWSLLLLLCSVFLVSETVMAQSRLAKTEQELADAIAMSAPGDTVVMVNGIWHNVTISFFARGEVGDTTVLRAETPGKVILTGNSRLRIWGEYLKIEGLWFDKGALDGGHVIEFRRSSSELAHHSRLTNCAVTNYNPPSVLTEYKWISVYGTHNRVDHCYLAGKTHDGATLVVWLRDPPDDAPVYHRIDHNFFGHRPELGKNGGETIRIGTSSRSMQDAAVVVERNLFVQCDGELEIISNKSGKNIFRYNTFRGSAGTLTLRHGNDAMVYGNFFFGEGKSQTGGVRIIGERHVVYNNYFQDLAGTGYRAALAVVNGVPDSPLNRYFPVKDALVAFNTFVNNRETFVIGAGRSAEQSVPPSNLMITNNLVQTTQGPIIEYEDTPLSVTYTTNIMYGADLGISRTDGINTIDPDLVEESVLYRPSAISSVINMATPLSFVLSDVDGQARDTIPDIGADEIVHSPITNRPLISADVGSTFAPRTLGVGETPVRQGKMLGVAPNPFDDHARLFFTVRRPGTVHLVVYDVLGREITRLLDSRHMQGEQSVIFNGSALAPGVYMAVLTVDEVQDTHLLVRR